MARIPDEIRQQVRGRADGRCEYCRLPESYSTFSHQIDHVIPYRHGGTDEIDNLAWACFRCNNNKSIDIASFDLATGELVPLFNPRHQVWQEHFFVDDSLILGRTPSGRITVRLLKMNEPRRIETRRDLIDAGQW